eukprot:gb/GECG01000340.1/.p1 GENE.gb/GECG01000340.1/~~gb/GECG01000340.1/.p1  ORF type:complete len:114 (+),score=14.94 gb/GECG01000340.1/:1-342(+)
MGRRFHRSLQILLDQEEVPSVAVAVAVAAVVVVVEAVASVAASVEGISDKKVEEAVAVVNEVVEAIEVEAVAVVVVDLVGASTEDPQIPMMLGKVTSTALSTCCCGFTDSVLK